MIHSFDDAITSRVSFLSLFLSLRSFCVTLLSPCWGFTDLFFSSWSGQCNDGPHVERTAGGDPSER